MIEANEVINHQYIVRNKIGAGSFGSIYLAMDQINNKKVAIKVEPTNSFFPLVIYEANVIMMMHEQGKLHHRDHNHFCYIYIDDDEESEE